MEKNDDVETNDDLEKSNDVENDDSHDETNDDPTKVPHRNIQNSFEDVSEGISTEEIIKMKSTRKQRKKKISIH